MIVKSVKINNYKSITEEQNILHLSQDVTTIIGKNESGKSNVIEAIGNLPMKRFVSNKESYFQNQNRNSNENIEIVVTLIESYIKSNEETKLIFKTISETLIEGHLSQLISQNSSLIESTNYILSVRRDSKNWKINFNNRNEVERLTRLYDYIENINKKFIANFEVHMRWMIEKIYSASEYREELKHHLENIIKNIKLLTDEIPSIFYKENLKILNSEYSLEDIKENFKDENDIFTKFLKVAEIDYDTIVGAFEEQDIGRRTDYIRLVKSNVNENINKKFNNFYAQEKIELDVQIQTKSLHFIVRSNEGKSLSFTERSNGLKWYISLFIELVSTGLTNRNLLILLDEPGNYLHVNAQKELIELFHNLTDDSKQLIYTTHSPSMIDTNNISNIRAVKKVNENTLIYNSVYNQKLSKNSKMETLSPLIQALGANEGYILGPSRDTMNLITEGMSDYYYVKAALSYLSLEDKVYVLPSVGAPNINRLVSIMIGWGCDFKVLLDFDREGWREYKKLTKHLDAEYMKDKIIFVNSKNSITESEVNDNPMTIEDIIDEELVNDYPELDKTLIAKRLYEAVNDGSYKLSDSTIENFKNIFEQLGV